jgi:uncharacterized protein YodC (DUF2158 family)
MSDSSLVVGDVVQLASGGLAMTVTHVKPDANDGMYEVQCSWSEHSTGGGLSQRQLYFRTAALRRVTLEGKAQVIQ